MAILLRSYYDKIQQAGTISDLKEADNLLYEYKRTLCASGWVDIHQEAGCVTPDYVAIFYYGRTPYEGELQQYKKGADREFDELKNKMIASGDFVDVDW